MKIAFISTMASYAWGGSEELWSQAAEQLVKQGHTVAVNVKWWPHVPDKLKHLQQLGCHIERRQEPSLAQRVINRVIPRSHYRWLEQFRPDFVVISQGYPLGGVEWAQHCLHCKFPYGLIVQAAAEHWWPLDAEVEPAREVYESAVASFFVAEANLALCRKQFVSPLNNARVVRNPYQAAYDNDWVDNWPDFTHGLKLACVGRLEPAAKGQDILFEVLRQEKWRLRNIHLTLAGGGLNSRSLQSLAAMYDLNNVHFSGFVQDIGNFWRDHHALVLASRYEGLPLAVVEAMMCGRVCIVSDVAGNAELIEDNKTGFVADAPTPHAFDAALERAWEQRDAWPGIGQAAFYSVREQVPPDPAGEFVNKLMQVMPKV